jgi:superfamily II DNA or RNA helicase
MSLTNNGIIIIRDVFNDLIDKYKLKKFCIKEIIPKNVPTVIQRHPRILSLYCILPNKSVWLARGLISYISTLEINFKKCRKFDKYKLGTNIAEHQEIVLRSIITRFACKEKCGTYFCQMATGMGKTRLAIAVIGQVGATTLVIVPTKHIATQWIEECEYLIPQIKICQYTNIKNQSASDYDICVIIINTARSKDKEFYSQFALVIIDEVHECTSSVNKKIMWLSGCCRFVLGLSATPEDTKNGLLPFLEGHIGKVVYARDLDGYNILAKQFKVTVEIVKYSGNIDYLTPVLNEGGTVSFVNTLARIISDPQRTDLLIDKIQKLYDSGNNILVFAEHRKYLDSLYQKLINIYKKDEIDLEADAKVLKGGATKDIVEHCRTAKIILTTFCYSRRGIDYSHLTALVLATPRRNGIKQIIGRILRFRSDDKIPRFIVDFFDCATVLKGQMYDRRKVYLSRGYTIKYSNYEGTD